MIPATKVKESRKHKRKEKNANRGISGKTQDSDENAKENLDSKDSTSISFHAEAKEPEKDELCETPLEILENTEEQNQVTETGIECMGVSTTPGYTSVMSSTFHTTKKNLDNTSSEELEKEKNIETSEFVNKSINYEKMLNELKVELKVCTDSVSQPSAPFPDTLLGTEGLSKSNELFLHSENDVDVNTEKCVKQENLIELEVMPDAESITPFSEEELSQFYYNGELNQAQEFIADFIREEINNEARVLHPFHELLSNYLKVKNNLQVSKQKISDLNEELDKYISKMWTVWNDVEVHEVGRCSDGNSVAATKKYTQANFNQEVFEHFKSALNEITSTLFETYSTDLFNCLKYKLKIEQYIQSLLQSCPEFSNLNESSGISLTQSSTDSYFQQCLSNLRIAIGILFSFQRRQKVDMNSSFLQESRQWLNDLISVLIRVGNSKDHLFILNHILRCPGGVGKWGSHFVQFPKSSVSRDPFSDPVINHIMAVMSIMLQNVEKREDFMNEWNNSGLPDENSWVVIDSEDEDDETALLSNPLKENDLVLLLNQIPLKYLFSSILGLANDKLNPYVITEAHLMKLFSFSSDFIKIVNSGLQIYSTNRYKQFAKRLGQLLRHIIEYATNELELFKSRYRGIDDDDGSVKRLQVEYDNFFLNSAKSIYSSRMHGTWQFLTVIPYHLLSRNAIVKLYSLLQLTDASTEKKFHINLIDFAEKFHQLPESEQFYLLSTFTSMVLARDLTELDFIKIVIHELLYIGFLSNLTKDQCYKSVKSLLFNICDKNPFLMSDILRLQNENFLSSENRDQSLSIYLWKELPIKTWKPSTEDLQILSSWLLQPVQSIRSELARTIVKSFNYGLDEGELFLPVEIHRMIADMILRACVTVPQNKETNVIKNVSTFVGLQEPEQVLEFWSWNVLLKLRLHIFDQSIASVRNSLQNLNESLRHIPELASLNELQKFVEQKNPIACFISLMTTTIGHSVPLIFNEGFALLEVLIRVRKSEFAIVCLEYMLLMFLECQESLDRCPQFTSVLSQLIHSDDTYLKLAKNLETPRPTILFLENMIQNQINLCEELFISRTVVIELWMKSLTKIQMWTEEPGILRLLNLLCKNAFFDVAASKAATDVLTESLLDCSSPPATKSSFASLVSWMNNKSTIPTLLPKGFDGHSVWYFLKVIEIEQELYETGNSLWNELLKELWWANSKKTNVDGCLKKVCSNLHIPVRSSEVLTIYRLTSQILETKVSHPMVIILWQKFFLLYFQRVPGLMDNGSVGDKFLHGVFNQNLLRRLKKRLEETIDCFRTLHKQSSETQNKTEFYLLCSEVLQVFHLWLEEPKLHESHLNVHLIPLHYNPELLQTIINQSSSLWMDFIDYDQCQNEVRKCILAWQLLKGRRTKQELPKSSSGIQEKSLADKIQDGLLRYEDPLPAPGIETKKYYSPGLARDILLRSDTFGSYLRPCFDQILEYSDFYVHGMREYVGLRCSLQDLVQRLYSTKTSTITLRSTCEGQNKIINGRKVFFKCSGPAVITISFEESSLNDQNYNLFTARLKNFNDCLHRSLLPLKQNLGVCVVTLEKAIDELNAEYLFMKTHSGDEKLVNGIKEMGVGLFYELVLCWCESVTLTPSVTSLFESCISSLGNVFIIDNPSECEHLINTINGRPHLVAKLDTFFRPNASHTQGFIDLYSKVKKCRPEVRVGLLSKFDLRKWLAEKRPRFAERSLLISEIEIGLKPYGSCPTEHLDLVQLFNTHLQQILMYDFPEHYGEMLNLLLKGSEAQTVPVSTWFMFLNAIVPEGINFEGGKCDGSNFEPGQPVKKLKFLFTQYATHQKLLSLADVRETILHLGNTFKTDRLKHGLHGLYPKYRHYVEPILIFCGMMSHSYVAETLKLDLGSLSTRIADQLWPLVRELYSPWLAPYWSKQEKSQMAKWIQELTDDKCVLLPWVSSDISYACYSWSIFISSVKFVFDTLPGINNLLSHVWFFYVTNYARIQVKDYVLRVVHKNLLHLPWCNFFPTLQDIELMVKVVEHFIPMAHSLLGNIYVKVKWTDIVTYYSRLNDKEILGKLHIYLLHLLVKLPCEPTLKQSNEIVALLTEAKDYSWHLVDSTNYDSVLNWFVMSCDPRIVLMDEKSEYYKLDSLILQILRICAGYTETAKEFHPTTVTKRLMYVRANNKWLTTANSRFKCKDSVIFKSAVVRILDEIESTVHVSISELQKTEEVAVLLSEFLNIFKEEDLSCVVEEIMINWLSTKRSSTLIYGLLKSIALSAVTPGTFGNIAEACLNSYFDSNEDSLWTDVNSKFVMYASGQSGLQKALISNSNLLTLHAILLKHFNDDSNLLEKKILISDLLHSITSAKRCESVEPKLVLMIIHVCRIAETVGRFDEPAAVSILSLLSGHLVNFVNDKGNGILSTLGLKKREAFSNSFKFICLVASGGLMKLFKTRYVGHEDKVDEKIVRSLEQAAANKQYGSISQFITIANEEMKKLESMEGLINLLKRLGLQIFNKNYLK